MLVLKTKKTASTEPHTRVSPKRSPSVQRRDESPLRYDFCKMISVRVHTNNSSSTLYQVRRIFYLGHDPSLTWYEQQRHYPVAGSTTSGNISTVLGNKINVQTVLTFSDKTANAYKKCGVINMLAFETFFIVPSFLVPLRLRTTLYLVYEYWCHIIHTKNT